MSHSVNHLLLIDDCPYKHVHDQCTVHKLLLKKYSHWRIYGGDAGTKAEHKILYFNTVLGEN